MHTNDRERAPKFPVLVVDGDPMVLALAAGALARAGYPTSSAQDVGSALEAARSNPPRIVVMDWALPGADVPAFCRELRGRRVNMYVYVVALAANARRYSKVSVLDEGADDYVSKPFAVDELVSRVGWAQRMLAALPHPSARLRATLADATQAGDCTVILRRGDTTGRIFFTGGKVAWAQVSDRPATLPAVFHGLAPAEAREVLEDSRRTRRNFAEILVERGLVTKESAVEALRGFIRSSIRAMLLMNDPRVMLAPSRGGWTGPAFDLSQVLPPETMRSIPAMRVPAPRAACVNVHECGACSRAASSIAADLRETGADGLALVHGPSGALLASAGEPIDVEILHAQLRILAAIKDRGAADDVVVSGGGRHYLLRATSCPDSFVCLTSSRRNASLRPLKLEIARVADRVFVDESPTVRMKHISFGPQERVRNA
jgi:CheY-like chemotaxis protein